ncbi:hypothetical protein Nmel_013300 [Mimus melanotis]
MALGGIVPAAGAAPALQFLPELVEHWHRVPRAADVTGMLAPEAALCRNSCWISLSPHHRRGTGGSPGSSNFLWPLQNHEGCLSLAVWMGHCGKLRLRAAQAARRLCL